MTVDRRIGVTLTVVAAVVAAVGLAVAEEEWTIQVLDCLAANFCCDRGVPMLDIGLPLGAPATVEVDVPAVCRAGVVSGDATFEDG